MHAVIVRLLEQAPSDAEAARLLEAMHLDPAQLGALARGALLPSAVRAKRSVTVAELAERIIRGTAGITPGELAARFAIEAPDVPRNQIPAAVQRLLRSGRIYREGPVRGGKLKAK